MVNQPDIVAAINANSFGEVPAPPPGTHPDWRVHLPVDIGGWAKNTREQRSLPQPGFWNFWIDPDNRPHIGDLKEPVPDARLAIAGFNPLVVDGKNVNPEDGQRHPRTAIGFDEAGKTLVMVVVDGRQRGFSEGMSSHELAGLMQELGCHNAINLDGGGTSIMFATDAGHLKIVNSPSQDGTRPTPVMLVVRKLAAAATGH